MSALSLHCNHDIVKQLALTRVVFKSLPTHPELCAGSLDPQIHTWLELEILLSNSRCGGVRATNYLEPNSQTNYTLTSLATRHSGLFF